MQRNIATLLRQGHDTHVHGKGYISQSVMDRISETFKTTGPYWKDRSYWNVYLREEYHVPHLLEEENQEPTSDFIYVSFSDDKPRAMYMAQWSLHNLEVAHNAAYHFDRYVLDKESNWPPRDMTEEGGAEFFNLHILTGGLCAATLLVLEGVIEGVQQGGPLTSASESISQVIRDNIAVIPFAATAAVYGILGYKNQFGTYLGRKADEMRVREIPEEAHSFLYGRQAIDAINAEHDMRVQEARKIKFYNELREGGMDMSKEAFLTLFDPSIEIDEKDNERLLQEYRKMSDIPKSIN